VVRIYLFLTTVYQKFSNIYEQLFKTSKNAYDLFCLEYDKGYHLIYQAFTGSQFVFPLNMIQVIVIIKCL